MSERRTASVRRIEFEMEWPPGHVACYLLDCEEPVLVDAGIAADESVFRAGLRDAGYEVADVEHLVVTHPHVDHIGQVPTVLEEADPNVYAPAGVGERLGSDPEALGERVRANAWAAGISGDQLDDAVEMAVESLRRNATLLPPEAVDVWVDPGSVEVGPFAFEAVHAPGHQAEHLCYRVDFAGESALLAGDMVLEPFRAVALHDGVDDGVTESFDAFYRALDRLASLDVDRVYPGHGPVHDEFDRVVARDLASLDRRLDDVVDQLEAGVRTVTGIAAALAGDRSIRYLIPEAMGALAHLETNGRARVTVEDGVTYYEAT
jgi:glyoxylase-like metal-dependent hydrolase (beta-lactamase superfamily II)